MTVQKQAKAVTKREIERHTRDDLREVYLLAFDQFAITPSDVEIYTTERVNTRYARELLGVLVHEGLLAVTDVNGEGDVWQVVNPGTYDDHTVEEAQVVIDEFLDRKIPLNNTPKENTVSTATATRPTTTPKPVANLTGKCRCGCNENVAKSNYRPGHDARHAGNVARDIAANYATKGYDRREALDALPSDALKVKAEAMAERLIAKTDAKMARAAAKDATPAPIIKRKVGRAVYEGVVESGEFHYLDRKGNEKQVAFDKTTGVDA